MNCRDIIEFLAEYLDGELSVTTHTEFERHLAICQSCVAYLATYRETIRVSRFVSVQKSDLLDDAPEELIEAILHSRQR
jgi:anti-sigma factor RsiW